MEGIQLTIGRFLVVVRLYHDISIICIMAVGCRSSFLLISCEVGEIRDVASGGIRIIRLYEAVV